MKVQIENDKPYVRLPSSSSPVKSDPSILGTPRPRPSPALLHGLRTLQHRWALARPDWMMIRLAEPDSDPVRPWEPRRHGCPHSCLLAILFQLLLLHREEPPGHRVAAPRIVVALVAICFPLSGHREPENLAAALPVSLGGRCRQALLLVGSVLDDHRGGAGIWHGSDPLAPRVCCGFVIGGLGGGTAFRFLAWPHGTIGRVVQIPHFFFLLPPPSLHLRACLWASVKG